MTKVAIFGGSFDPPHLGHQLVVSYLLGHGFDEVVICPTAKHAVKNLLDFRHRYKMVHLMAHIFDPSKVSVSSAELNVMKWGGFKDSRTINLVKYFVGEKGAPDELTNGSEYHLVMGSDLIEQAKTWDNWDEVEKLVRIFVVGRLGYGNQKLVLPNISSSEIRKDISLMKEYLPQSVYQYIVDNNLYGANQA